MKTFSVGQKIKVPPGNYEADIEGKIATVFWIDPKTGDLWLTDISGFIEDFVYILEEI